MKLSDLKVGDVHTDREGDDWIIVKNPISGEDPIQATLEDVLCQHNDDLTDMAGETEMDIIAVHRDGVEIYRRLEEK